MTHVRPASNDDLDRIVRLHAQAFNSSPASQEKLRRDFGPDVWRVVETTAGIVGAHRLIPFAHFWGGRPVPAAGIASVAVAPEWRGRGIGALMMERALRELRERRVAISSLYPATVPIYRRAGYGFAGLRTVWKAPLEALPVTRGGDVEAFGEEAIGELNDAYEAIAAAANGLPARDRDWWEKRVLAAASGSGQNRYLVREQGRVTGWIAYSGEHRAESWRYTLSCRDFFWTTAHAGRTLLSLASLHRSTADAIQWAGAPSELIGDLTAEDVPEVDHRLRWMVRLVDVPAAFEARGYHPLLDAAVTVRVSDPLLPENEGPWRVEVARGRAKVSPSDDAEATASVGTWASVWSGLHGPADAVRLDALDATPRALEVLDALFAGPVPWSADYY